MPINNQVENLAVDPSVAAYIVAQTAKVLDRKHPQWAWGIETEALNSCDPGLSVGGQLFGTYREAMVRLGIGPGTDSADALFAFNIADAAMLDLAWKGEVCLRVPQQLSFYRQAPIVPGGWPRSAFG